MAWCIIALTLAALAPFVVSAPTTPECERLTAEASIILSHTIREEPELWRRVLPQIVGFDLFDTEQLTNVLCSLAAERNTRGLTETLHDLDLLYHGAKYYYGMEAFRQRMLILRYADHDMEDASAYMRANIHFATTLNNLGLLDLDPVVSEISGYDLAPEATDPGDVDRCALLQEATEGYLLALREREGDRWDAFVDEIIIGTAGQINLNDMEGIREIACFVAGVHSVRGIYDMLYERFDLARIVGAQYGNNTGRIRHYGESLYRSLGEAGIEFDQQNYTDDVDEDDRFADEIKMFNFLNAIIRSGLMTLQQLGLPFEITPGEHPVPPSSDASISWMKWRLISSGNLVYAAVITYYIWHFKYGL